MFGDRLKLTLTLVIGGDTFSLHAGAIKHLDVSLTPYGFEAEVGFFVDSEEEPDAVFPRFTTTDLVKATLTIANGRVIFADDASHPLTLMGYAIDRRVREVVSEAAAGVPVVGRHYVVRFVDPAQALWRQHRPIELYVDTSMQDVIDLHKAAGMDISYDWAALGEALDVLCVGLGGESGSTFYDFVIWYLHENHGVMELEPGTGAYRIAKTKSRSGTPVDLDPETVAEIEISGPDPVRFSTTVLNPSTEAALAQAPLPNDKGALGVYVGAFAHTAIATRFAKRVQIEAERLVLCEHGISVTYKACPETFLAPGKQLSLGEEFSDELYPSGKKYRITDITLRAMEDHDEDGEDDLEATTAAYQIELVHKLELLSDTTPRLPPFRRPMYPVSVEGRVLSASGQDQDRTFHALPGERDSLYQYRINIPLWNKIVVAPYVPNGFSGHYFFPAYKNQRVLVALEFDSARIAGFLEWAGKLSKDTQGDQIVLGWNETSPSHTIVSHVYADDKPVLTVARRQDNDTETMTVSEGTIFMIVKEEQATPKATPTYDVTPNVDTAKAQTSAAVRGAISTVTGSYESSMGDVTSSIDGARGEVDGALGASAATLNAKLADSEGQLEAMSASAQQAVDALGTSIAGAKGAIQDAVSG